MKKTGIIRVGTSGWHYAHWVGPFYPEGTPPERFLEYYSARFDTVEINNTFYRLPDEKTFGAWAVSTPPGFIFSVKASRLITHLKKLKEPSSTTPAFFKAAGSLGGRLGPVLFQLPPRWRANPGRLEGFLEELPEGPRYAFEFRDGTWHTDEIYDILKRHKAAFCIFDLDRRESPPVVTAGFVYVRLHGPDGPYRGRYPDGTIRRRAEEFAGWAERGLDVYCYFDNDEAGYAPADALRLAAALGRPGNGERKGS